MLDFPCIWRYFKRNKADFPVYNIKGVKKIKILFFCFTLIQNFNKMSQNILKLALRRNIMNTVFSGGGSLRILPHYPKYFCSQRSGSSHAQGRTVFSVNLNTKTITDNIMLKE